jgi:hypothetical protein
MPTNAQLEARDKLAAARARIKLIREGILSRIEGEAIRLQASNVPSRTWDQADRALQSGKGRVPDFHIPASRPVRLKSATGMTSFHFSHSAVSRVTCVTQVEGLRNAPGAAKAHSRYIERDNAVAGFEAQAGLDRAAQQESLDGGAQFSTPDDVAPSDEGLHRSTPEEHHDEQYTAARLPGTEIRGPLVGEIAALQSDPVGIDTEGSVEGPGPDAGLQLLSSSDLVYDGWGAEHLLLSPADVSLETGQGGDGLRRPPQGDRGNGKEPLNPDRSSPAADFDHYLRRPGALSIQPDSGRALITNIDHNDDARAEYWSLVEKHERKPSPDKMTFRACDHPEFWARVLSHPDCPAEIRAKLEGPDRDELRPITIASGKRVRGWLRKQPGWFEPQPNRKRAKNEQQPRIAKFVDGRGGRVQYRIVGELPDELTPEQNFAVLKDFAQEFEKREMPFVAVMHAPDEHNHSKNWHFHLAYSDRPARRITQDDINCLARQGYDVDLLKPGMWDFAVEVPVPGRNNRTTFPFRQNKVAEVSRDKDWPKTLRVALARIVNQHLSAAGVERRVSPETYEHMGIVADPAEHLGTRQNAMETRGIATSAGVANEEKQWAAIQAQAKQRYEAEIAEAEARIARILRSQSADNEVAVAELRVRLERAAKLRHDATILEQEMERAASRAVMVRDRNLQLLKAAEADPKAANPREVAKQCALVGMANRYLAVLDHDLTDERALATRWRATARHCMDTARAMEEQLLTGVRKEQPTVQPARTHPEPQLGRLPKLPARAPHVPPVTPAPAVLSPLQAEIQRRIDEIKARQATAGEASQPQIPSDPMPKQPAAPAQRRAPSLPPPQFDSGR